MKDHFYRYNFFALVKWVLVLTAALIGRQAANTQTWAGKKENKSPLKKAFMLLVVATLVGMAEMHSAKKFHKGMRKMWEQKDFTTVENQPTPQQVRWLDNPTPTVQAKFLDSASPEPAHEGKHHGKHGKGKKCVIFATLIWMALVLPFLRLFKQFTVNMHKLHKVNKKCNEAQRQEVAKKVIQSECKFTKMAIVASTYIVEKLSTKKEEMPVIQAPLLDEHP